MSAYCTYCEVVSSNARSDYKQACSAEELRRCPNFAPDQHIDALEQAGVTTNADRRGSSREESHSGGDSGLSDSSFYIVHSGGGLAAVESLAALSCEFVGLLGGLAQVLLEPG